MFFAYLEVNSGEFATIKMIKKEFLKKEDIGRILCYNKENLGKYRCSARRVSNVLQENIFVCFDSCYVYSGYVHRRKNYENRSCRL